MMSNPVDRERKAFRQYIKDTLKPRMICDQCGKQVIRPFEDRKTCDKCRAYNDSYTRAITGVTG